MAEREVAAPVTVSEGRVTDIAVVYEEAPVREPWFAPNRDNPRELIVKGEIIGEPVAYVGRSDTSDRVEITIYPIAGIDGNGDAIEGSPIRINFDPTVRARRRTAIPTGVGLIMVEDLKGRTFIEGHSRIVTHIDFAPPRVR